VRSNALKVRFHHVPANRNAIRRTTGTTGTAIEASTAKGRTHVA